MHTNLFEVPRRIWDMFRRIQVLGGCSGVSGHLMHAFGHAFNKHVMFTGCATKYYMYSKTS
jgi:hypothetical protein